MDSNESIRRYFEIKFDAEKFATSNSFSRNINSVFVSAIFQFGNGKNYPFDSTKS
jgi:hypothetical protein